MSEQALASHKPQGAGPHCTSHTQLKSPLDLELNPRMLPMLRQGGSQPTLKFNEEKRSGAQVAGQTRSLNPLLVVMLLKWSKTPSQMKGKMLTVMTCDLQVSKLRLLLAMQRMMFTLSITSSAAALGSQETALEQLWKTGLMVHIWLFGAFLLKI